MAIENSSFGILPEDQFIKPKTLASNSGAVPVPLTKTAVNPNQYLQPGQLPAEMKQQAAATQAGAVQVPAPTKATVQAPPPITAPATTTAPEAKVEKKSYISEGTIPAPQTFLAEKKAEESKRLVEEADKAAEETRKILQKQLPIQAPAPQEKVTKKEAEFPAPPVAATSLQQAMEPFESMYDARNKAITQQYNAQKQYNVDLMSQQVAEMEAKGTGVANALYKSLIRDSDASYSTAKRALTEDYLAKKSSVLMQERATEQARIDEYSDEMQSYMFSLPDVNSRKALAQFMAETTGMPYWTGLVGNEAAWKALEIEADQKWQQNSVAHKQNAAAATVDPIKTESQKKETFDREMTASMADPFLQAKTWAVSEGARKELIDAYGKENGDKIYSSMVGLDDQGLLDTFLDVVYKKTEKEMRKTESIGRFESMLPPADTEVEKEINKQMLDKMFSGSFAGMLSIDVDGSGNLKEFYYDVSRYKEAGRTIIPSEVPGVDIFFKDWNGRNYTENYKLTDRPIGDWQVELDKAYTDYLDGYDKEEYGPIVSRNEFRDAMVNRDEEGNIISVKTGDPKKIVGGTAEAAKPTGLGVLDRVSSGEITGDTITNDQLKALAQDEEAKIKLTKGQYGFMELPKNGGDVDNTSVSFSYDKFNPPKLTYYVAENGVTIPMKLNRVYTTSGTDSNGRYNRLNYEYVDGFGNPKIYNTKKFLVPTSKRSEYQKKFPDRKMILNGIEVEIPNGLLNTKYK